MPVAVANALLLTDGDAAFLRVDNRSPAHALPPGVAAAATNKRFEQGKAGPRYGVACDDWGRPARRVSMASPDGDLGGHARLNNVIVTGRSYTLTNRSAYQIAVSVRAGGADVQLLAPIPAGDSADFDSLGDSLDVYTPLEIAMPYGPILLEDLTGPPTAAYSRFSDPTTRTDQTILFTADWREGAGEDGGIGRAWRIAPGNAPQAISLNGHDVWDTARLEQCHNAMVLVRHGNERHYFIAADVDTTADTIKIHCAPSWGPGAANAKRCRYELAAEDSSIPGASAPAAGNYYFAKYTLSGGNHLLELYSDSGCTNKMVFDADVLGKFYVELATDPMPFFGNGAPPLILQPSFSAGVMSDAFATGFVAVNANVLVTAANETTEVFTAPNHRLAPGDQVTAALSTDTFTGKYSYPRSEHTFVLYASLAEALADSGTKLDITAGGQTGTVKKVSAAGLPMPPLREVKYLAGRLWGINGDDQVIVSDPWDFLHFTRYVGNVAANQGEAGRANWLLPLGEDVMLIGKDLKIIILANVNQAISQWRESTLTQEYGGLAALAALNVGSDAWFLSRKGVASIARTIAGERLAVARTVSHNIPMDLANVDWMHAVNACAATWNNRTFFAVPLKGQTEPINNAVLVHNALNQGLRLQQTALAGQIVGQLADVDPAQTIALGGDFAWEGTWTGALLIPYAFSRLTVNGEERLTWATPDGLVCWFHDGWDDAGAVIEDELITRGYFGSREVLALQGTIQLETFDPSLSAYVRTAGVHEESALTGFDPLTRDRTKYLVNGVADYDPATSTPATFAAPYREDYSPSPEELLSAELDAHQTITEPFRCRERDFGIQLRLANAQGSCRIVGTAIQGRPVGINASRKA